MKRGVILILFLLALATSASAEYDTRQGFFERPDLEAVVAALPTYLQDFTRFAYLTRWRKGETSPSSGPPWTGMPGRSGSAPRKPRPAEAAPSCWRVILPS